MNKQLLWGLVFLGMVTLGVTWSESATSTQTAPNDALAKFFRTMKEGGGKPALESISDIFQPDESSGRLLALKIDEMLSTFGALENYEFLGTQTIGGEEKYAEFGYVSYHQLGPVLWEAAVYRRTTGWVILRLKFSTDNLIERAEEYKQPN